MAEEKEEKRSRVSERLEDYFKNKGYEEFRKAFNGSLKKADQMKPVKTKAKQEEYAKRAIDALDRDFGIPRYLFPAGIDGDEFYDYIVENGDIKDLIRYPASTIEEIKSTPEFADKFIPKDVRRVADSISSDKDNETSLDIMEEMYNNDIEDYERNNFLNFIYTHPSSIGVLRSDFDKIWNSSHEGKIHNALEPLVNTKFANILGFVPGKEELSRAIEERLKNAEDEITDDEDEYDRLGNQEAFLDAVRKHYNPRGKEARESFGAKPNAGDWIDMKDMDKSNFFDVEDLMAYLDKYYPEEDLEDQLEDFAEEEPEVAEKFEDVIPETAEEAKQVQDDNPHNDEANNEEIKKDASLLKHNYGMLSDKDFDAFVDKVDSGWTPQKELNSVEYPEYASPEEKEGLKQSTISSFKGQGGAGDVLREKADLIDRGVDYDEDSVADSVYNTAKDDDSKTDWQSENLGEDPDKAAARLRWKSNWVSNEPQPYTSVEELNQDSSIKEGDVKNAFEKRLNEYNAENAKATGKSFRDNLDALNAQNDSIVEKPITPFQDYAMGMKSKEMEDDRAKLQQDLQAGNAQEVEKAIETQKVTPGDIPQDSPLHKEAQQVTDGDKRTTEVNNDAVQKAIKQASYNVPFERFEQLSPEEQRLRVKFNEKHNLDPEVRDALHEFSGELDRVDVERAKAQAADDYMDDDEKRELAQWIEDNVPAPKEEEEEEEEKEEEEEEEKKGMKIPKLLHPKLAHSSINNMKLDTEGFDSNGSSNGGHRAPGSSLLGNIGSHSGLTGGSFGYRNPSPDMQQKFATVDPLRVSGSIDYSRNAPNEVQNQSRGVAGPGTSMFGNGSGLLKSFNLDYKTNRGGNIRVGDSGIKANFTGFTGGSASPIYSMPGMIGGNEDVGHKLLIDIPTIKAHIREIWPRGHEEPGLSVQVLGRKILINGVPIEEVDEATMRKIQSYF